jgi:hypothetical protein
MQGANAVNRYVNDDIDTRILPELSHKSQALEAYAESLGILFGYPDYSGWRSQADTTQLITWRNQAVASFGPGAYYPVASFGSGYHGKGAAFDIKVVKWPAGKSSAWAYQTLGAFAPRIGLRWGGLFPGKFTDIYHFELAISLGDAQARFNQWQLSQRQARAAGKSAPVLNSSALSTATGNLTFPDFQFPVNPSALPKSQAEINLVASLSPTGAVALGVVVALALVVTGFFLPVVSRGAHAAQIAIAAIFP